MLFERCNVCVHFSFLSPSINIHKCTVTFTMKYTVCKSAWFATANLCSPYVTDKYDYTNLLWKFFFVLMKDFFILNDHVEKFSVVYMIRGIWFYQMFSFRWFSNKPDLIENLKSPTRWQSRQLMLQCFLLRLTTTYGN